MSNNSEPQCPNCQHDMRTSSCGACVSMGIEKTKNLIHESTDGRISINKKDELRYTCKVVMNNPEDFEKIDPFNCQYFLSNAFKLF